MPKLSSVIEQVSGSFKMVKGMDVDITLGHSELGIGNVAGSDILLIDDVSEGSGTQTSTKYVEIDSIKNYILANVSTGSGSVTNNYYQATGDLTDVTSIYNVDLKIGRGTDNLIDFNTDNQITFRVDDEDGVSINPSGAISATSLTLGNNSVYAAINQSNFSSNSSTRVPTQSSVKSYVDNAIDGVVLSGGGSITVKADGDGTGSVVDTITGVTSITFMGDDDYVKVYDEGGGSVIVDHHGSYAAVLEDPFYIVGGAANPVYGMSDYWIGTPTTDHNFFAGDWAGQTDKKATNATSIQFFSPNNVGGWKWDNQWSSIKVIVEGPGIVSDADSNVLNEHEQEVSGNGSWTNNGITIEITGWTEEPVGYYKARCYVTIDLDSADLIYTEDNYTGSQKYSAIKIKQIKYDGSTIYEFVSDSFFYDNKSEPPTTPGSPSVSFTGSGSKQVSRINYYTSGSKSWSKSNMSNLAVDTGHNEQQANLQGVKDISGLGDGDDSTNSVSGTASYSGTDTRSRTSASIYVYGGLGGNSGTSSTAYSSPYICISTDTGTQTTTSEDFKGETYRIASNNLSSVESNGSAQGWSASAWQSKCCNSVPHDDNSILMQGYFKINGSTSAGWGLVHPSKINSGSIASSPTQVWSSPGSGTYYYYRVFRRSSEGDQWSINIGGLTKSTFEASSDLSIHFKMPGSGGDFGVWSSLKTNHSSANNNGCWANSASQGSSSKQYDLSFNTACNAVIMRIGMSGTYTGRITSLSMSTSHQN